VLSLLAVQILAACSFAGAIASILLGGVSTTAPRASSRVVASRRPGRGAELLWLAGTAIAVAWPLGVLFAPGYAVLWPVTSDFLASGAIQLIGFLVAVAGGILFFAARRALGRHMTPAIEVRENHQLVQAGPYYLVRHPAYTAIVTSAWGLSLLFLSPLLAADAAMLTGMAVYRARLEEELLGSPEAFGRHYAEYAARTGRFLPRIGSPPETVRLPDSGLRRGPGT